MAAKPETTGAQFTKYEAVDRVSTDNILAGPCCPKCFEGSGTVSQMEMVEPPSCSGHFANFRYLSCPVCNHSVDL